MPVHAKKKSEELEFYNPTNIIFVLFQYFINVLVYLGPGQTSNFTWAKLNENVLRQKTFLIYIEFGSCEVRRLARALFTLFSWVI